MSNFREFLNESRISVSSTDSLGNTHTLIVNGSRVVLVNKLNRPLSLDTINFNEVGANGESIRGKGYAAAGAAVKELALSAQSSKDLANKLNKSGMGFANWA